MKRRLGEAMRTPRQHVGRWAAAGVILLLMPLGGWVLLHHAYDSWHPCDPLLVDRVAPILRKQGVAPDAASTSLKATVAESSEVRAALQLWSLPGPCRMTGRRVACRPARGEHGSTGTTGQNSGFGSERPPTAAPRKGQGPVKRSTAGEEAPDTIRVAKPGFTEEALPWMDAVYRFALRLSRGQEAEAEDLVQSTLLRAYRSWGTFSRGSNCKSWLFTICRNEYLRSEEKRGRRREIFANEIDADVESLAATAVFSEVDSADPERSFFDSFVDEEVLRAIDRLEEPFRETLILSDMEGLSYPEVGEVLGVPVGTVKSRLFRARRVLQQTLYAYALEMGYIRPREQA